MLVFRELLSIKVKLKGHVQKENQSIQIEVALLTLVQIFNLFKPHEMENMAM